jgi:hypothetical protein
MVVFNRVPKSLIAATCVVMTAHCVVVNPALAHTQAISILIVRHAEADGTHPTIPLTTAGRQRADVLAQTLRGVTFTHIFTSHTTRTRQMVESIAAAQGIPIVQLPEPGSWLDGHPVTEQTSRRAPIEPIATALLQLPPGSVALVALNSENIFAILHRLGVPLAPAGQAGALGSLCVPCTDNSCYPRSAFDHLWHLVREAGRPEPRALLELRYGAGGRAPEP